MFDNELLNEVVPSFDSLSLEEMEESQGFGDVEAEATPITFWTVTTLTIA